MKKLFWIFGLCCCLPLWATDDTQPLDMGAMLQWESYASYFQPTDLVLTNNHVFELAEGALFSVDRRDGSISRWGKKEGMHGETISRIAYIESQDAVLVIYADNLIDIISSRGEIEEIADLYQSATPIKIWAICVHNQTAYIGTDFGIIALNLKKHEVSDIYYIGPNASSIPVSELAVLGDTLFAISGTNLYKGNLKDQLINYKNWEIEPTGLMTPYSLTIYRDQLWILSESKLRERQNGEWLQHLPVYVFSKMMSNADKLFLVPGEKHIYEYRDTVVVTIYSSPAAAAIYDTKTHLYWVAAEQKGVVEVNGNYMYEQNHYIPDGPIRNEAYHLQFAGEKLFVCPGGRWASENRIDATFAYYKDGQWGYETAKNTEKLLGVAPTDLVAVAVDPNDDSHFFMSTYSRGVLEYRNNKIYKQYTEGTPGCTFTSLIEGNPKYVRTEGATIDDGYLWVLQTLSDPYTFNVMNLTTGQWYGYNFMYRGQRISSSTYKGIWIDRRDSHYKWFFSQRSPVGIFLINDNSTPNKGTDDYTIYRSELQDQNGKTFSFGRLNDMAQDKNGDFWVGFNEGVFIIPAESDFFSSNACKRVIIPRNDGTGLADYLLGTENVTAIAVDGGNRKWLGTETSGVYLVSEDGMRTIYHFTVENSPLLSNNITSIAIHPTSGEVFIGTSAGIVSFRSDAAEPFETFNNIKAYPNPIRPNYDGVVTITGLMDQSDVNIIDQAGQLVCKTKSNGGIAIWDLKNGDGKRVGSSIYTALCNDAAGKHQVVKIMVMNR